MNHSLKMVAPNQPTLGAGKLINSRDYNPLLHTKSYLDVASEFGCLPTTIHFNPKEHHDFIVNRLVDNTQQLEELAIFERIQIYQRDRSCVYDSGKNTTSAATVLHDLLFGEWNTVEKDMLKIGQECLRELSMRTPK